MSIEFLNNIEFDMDYIEFCLSKVDNFLKQYINNNILKEYDLNDKGHDNKDEFYKIAKIVFNEVKNK